MNSHFQEFSSPTDVKSWVAKYKFHFPSDNDTDKTFLEAINFYTASANLFLIILFAIVINLT